MAQGNLITELIGIRVTSGTCFLIFITAVLICSVPTKGSSNDRQKGKERIEWKKYV